MVGEHRYYSTACLHELHDQCRRTCKFCDDACRCECHALIKARSLLGQQVVVTLEHETGDRPAVLVKGQLLRLADSGEVVVRSDDGFRHYCWPMLAIRALDIGDADQREGDDAT